MLEFFVYVALGELFAETSQKVQLWVFVFCFSDLFALVEGTVERGVNLKEASHIFLPVIGGEEFIYFLWVDVRLFLLFLSQKLLPVKSRAEVMSFLPFRWGIAGGEAMIINIYFRVIFSLFLAVLPGEKQFFLRNGGKDGGSLFDVVFWIWALEHEAVDQGVIFFHETVWVAGIKISSGISWGLHLRVFCF